MAKYFSTLIFISWIFAGCATSQENANKADLHLQIGTGHLSKGQYPDAIRELLVAEQLDPENPLIQNNLAIALFARKRVKESIEHFQKALQLKNDYTEARNNLARAYIEMNQFNEAIRELKIVLDDITYPQTERAHVNLGLAYMKTRQYVQAQKSFQEALSLNRSYCVAHNYYGQTLYFQKKYNQAAAALDSAIQLCQNLDEAHYYNALSYLGMGQTEKARARMNEIVSLYPESSFAQKAKMQLLKLEQ
ncbi:MAG: tetratricopeptide repeat protein [Bdellovibrionales bacterium]